MGRGAGSRFAPVDATRRVHDGAEEDEEADRTEQERPVLRLQQDVEGAVEDGEDRREEERPDPTLQDCHRVAADQ